MWREIDPRAPERERPEPGPGRVSGQVEMESKAVSDDPREAFTRATSTCREGRPESASVRMTRSIGCLLTMSGCSRQLERSVWCRRATCGSPIRGQGHVPHRYQVSKGFVIDADGAESHFIGVIIYDRQYTPCIFNREGNMYISAESVCAVLEAKQDLDKEHVEYAGKKAASVRKRRRTSAEIKHAGGKHSAITPGPILAGILTYQSSWKDPFGNRCTTCWTPRRRTNAWTSVSPLRRAPSKWTTAFGARRSPRIPANSAWQHF